MEVDPDCFRPTEVELLIGDATKAREKLGWQPKIKFAELVREMVESDLRLFSLDSSRAGSDAGKIAGQSSRS